MPDDAPLSERIVPRRASAKKATETTKATLDLSGSESESETDPSGGKRRRGRGRTLGSGTRTRKPTAKKDKGGKASLGVRSSSTAGSSSPVAAKRRTGSIDQSTSQNDAHSVLDIGYESELTPLSSPAPQEKSPSLKGLREHPMFASLGSESFSPVSPGPSSLKRKAPAKKSARSWSLESLGKYVWVLLNGKNGHTTPVFDPKTDDADGVSQERLWWPAIVIDDPPIAPLHVQLLGTPSRTVAVPNPSAENVLSRLRNNSQERFTSYESALMPSSGLSGSPRKRQRLMDDKNKHAWESAIYDMQFEIQSEELAYDDDHLPPSPVIFLGGHLNVQSLTKSWSMSNLKGKQKENRERTSRKVGSKKKRKYQSDTENEYPTDFSEDETGPPPTDGNLIIPGEHILARAAQASLTEYWPAILEEYLPPKRGKNKGKTGLYRVKYFDGTQGTISRTFFYTQEEDGFATCKLGQIDSYAEDDVNDEEEEEHKQQTRDSLRESSPSPAVKVPPPNKFTLLPIRQQFAYTKKILQAILMDEYHPIRAKRRQFMKGGTARIKVTKASTSRGLMDPRSVEDLTTYVTHWCLRNQLEVNKPVDRGEEEPASMGNVGASGNDMVDLTVPPRQLSPSLTEATLPLSSPPQVPPSSSFSPLSERSVTQDGNNTTEMLASLPDDTAADVPESAISNEVGDTIPQNTESTDIECNEPSVSSRQKGSADYEDLPTGDKLSFCMDILLPEAVRQILLFWNGLRTTIDLLSPEEEQVLFDKGQELLDQTDWVFDIKHLRKWKEGLRRRKRGDMDVANGRSGRARKRINYQDMC